MNEASRDRQLRPKFDGRCLAPAGYLPKRMRFVL